MSPLVQIRQQTEQARRPEYWRSLDELAHTPEFREALEREFPQGASEWQNGDRRRFLQLMGASLALSGVTGCTRQPPEPIVPYREQPETLVPGFTPMYFATAVPHPGGAMGVLVRSITGRPVKVEGNPLHPASLGATDVISQASILSLYEPSRASAVKQGNEVRTWADLQRALIPALAAQRAKRGAGLRFLSTTVLSPTQSAQMEQLLALYPEARWYQYEPCGPFAARAGARLAFGRPVQTLYDFTQADVVVSLDADFLHCNRWAHDFAGRRRERSHMNRLYVIESGMSSTGGKADHRLPVEPLEVDTVARQLLGGATNGWLGALQRDLQAHLGRSIIIAGEYQTPAVHALAHTLNQRYLNTAKTVTYVEPVEARPADDVPELRALTAEMQAGKVELLVIVEGDPVFTAPSDIPFAQGLARVPLRIHFSEFANTTTTKCHWHAHKTHPFESWSDTRAYDGTATIIQPLIAPLYDARTVHEFLALFSDRPGRSSYDIVREHWALPEEQWQQALHDGIVPNTQSAPVTVVPTPPPAQRTEGPEFTIRFQPDPYLFDGRYAHNAWLMELPRPLTKITWDNAALFSPATAARLGVQNHDVVELKRGGATMRLPAYIQPGHSDGSVTVSLGFAAVPIRTSDQMWIADGVSIRRTGERYKLAATQMHFVMEGRDLVREDRPEAKTELHGKQELSLYPEWEYRGYAWGMAIDLATCVNCNACVIACQAENNIPVVGREQVLFRREMHWLRVDTYYKGDWNNPEVYYQPLPCMHCENAPCELVCPVEATVHSRDGLNDMIYNRCVGTRYCSNNCPYKVRRFNYLQYTNHDASSLKLMRNPDVTVRARGVMEKCTYCVQRIRQAEINARMENRRIRDGEVQTACQQACPTQAIIFGDINDPTSKVTKMKAEPRNYSLLAELNTQPRTTYLAAMRNRNAELA